jgi:hypothetical protein
MIALLKINEKFKAKLARPQDVIENLLEKMKILSIHNNELTTKIESMVNTIGASLVEIYESMKWLALVRPCMIRKAKQNKTNFLRITPLPE